MARQAEINRNDVLKIHYLQRNQTEISDVRLNIRLVAKSTEGNVIGRFNSWLDKKKRSNNDAKLDAPSIEDRFGREVLKDQFCQQLYDRLLSLAAKLDCSIFEVNLPVPPFALMMI